MRSNFSSSRLVRLLNTWAPADAEVSRQDFAERLGQWVGVSDAITLHAAQQSMQSTTLEKPRPVSAAGIPPLQEEFQRVRTALVQAIMAGGAGGGSAKGVATTDADARYAPHRKRYLDLQRHMEMRIAALRRQVRQALSTATPELAQLATLDAVLDRMLVDREQKLLSAVPVFLEQRFEHLRKNHPPAPQDPSAGPQDPAASQAPGGWLDVFGAELQQLLLAELDDRLQPVMGLVEAFSNRDKQKQ